MSDHAGPAAESQQSRESSATVIQPGAQADAVAGTGALLPLGGRLFAGGDDLGANLRRLPTAERHRALLDLQRTTGNRAVQSVLHRPADPGCQGQLIHRIPPRHHAAPRARAAADPAEAGAQRIRAMIVAAARRRDQAVLDRIAAALRGAEVSPGPFILPARVRLGPPLVDREERVSIPPDAVQPLLGLATGRSVREIFAASPLFGGATAPAGGPVAGPAGSAEPFGPPRFDAQISATGGTLEYGNRRRVVLTVSGPPRGDRPPFAYDYQEPTPARAYSIIRIVAAPGVAIRQEGFPADFAPGHMRLGRENPLVEIFRVQDVAQVPRQGEPILPQQFTGTSAAPAPQTMLGPILPAGMGRILLTQLPNGVEFVPERPGRYRNEGADPTSEVNRNLGRAGHALGNAARNVGAFLRETELPGWEAAPTAPVQARRGLRVTVPPGRADARYAYEIDYTMRTPHHPVPTIRVIKTPAVSVGLFGANPEAFQDFYTEVYEVASPSRVPAQGASLASPGMPRVRVTTIGAQVELTPYQALTRQLFEESIYALPVVGQFAAIADAVYGLRTGHTLILGRRIDEGEAALMGLGALAGLLHLPVATLARRLGRSVGETERLAAAVRTLSPERRAELQRLARRLSEGERLSAQESRAAGATLREVDGAEAGAARRERRAVGHDPDQPTQPSGSAGAAAGTAAATDAEREVETFSHEQLLELFTRLVRRPGPMREAYIVYPTQAAFERRWRLFHPEGEFPAGWHSTRFARASPEGAIRGHIHLPPRSDPLSMLHEALHWAAERAGAPAELGVFWNEGVTEWLARRHLGQRAARHGYDPNVRFVEELVREIGPEPMIVGYLDGEWGPLRAAIEARVGGRRQAAEVFELMRGVGRDDTASPALQQVRVRLRIGSGMETPPRGIRRPRPGEAAPAPAPSLHNRPTVPPPPGRPYPPPEYTNPPESQ